MVHRKVMMFIACIKKLNTIKLLPTEKIILKLKNSLTKSIKTNTIISTEWGKKITALE